MGPDPSLPDPVEELMARCLERPPKEREAAIEEACTSHPEHAGELRKRMTLLARWGMETAEPKIPERLGDFRLLERLGGGGMGVVYLAEQESLHRRVALKLIRPEQLYFPGARERFRRETEAVAQLQHPGIVPIYLVGEQDGVPYFAMERVDGCTLAEVLEALAGRAPESLTGEDLARAVEQRRHRARSDDPPAAGFLFGRTWTEACLRIAVEIAEALGHAHSRGIVHRDVKPSNVAITASGRALLFDFGLTSSEATDRMTRTGSQPGTLLYMSPGQLKGARPEPRDDLYALGVTLYELLTLQVPYRGDSALSTQNLILEGRPDSIRARNRKVSPETETVCLTAMDRDAARRYASAAALKRDLENVLARRPIEARPPGPFLRARRFVERRPAASAASALAFLLLTVTPTALFLQERRHVELVRNQYETADESLAVLESLFRASSPDEAAGRTVTVREVLDAARARLATGLAKKPAVRVRLLQTLGTVYSDLGLQDDAIPLFEEAISLVEPIRGKESLHYASLEALLAYSTALKGERARGEEMMRSAMARIRRLLPEEHREVGVIRNNLALLLILRGKSEEAAELLRRTAEFEKSTGERITGSSAVALNLATALIEAGKLDDAEPLFEQAIEGLRADKGERHPHYATALHNYGLFLKKAKRYPEALKCYEDSLAVMRAVYGERSDKVATCILDIAGLREAQGMIPEAEEGYRDAAARMKGALGEEHPSSVIASGNLASLLFRSNKTEEAAKLYETVLPLQKKVFEGTPLYATAGFSAHNLAMCRGKAGDLEAFEALMRESLEIFERVSPNDPPEGRDRACLVLADHLERTGREDEAIPFLVKAEPRLRATRQAVLVWLDVMRRIALGDLRRGDTDAAVSKFREAVDAARAAEPGGWRADYYRTHLGAALAAQGKGAEAETELKEGTEAVIRALGEKNVIAEDCLERLDAYYAKTGLPASRPR